MTVKKPISAIIKRLGNTEFGRRVSRDPSYMSRVQNAHSQGSVALLGRALGAFGDELDLEATLRELVPEEIEIGRLGREAGHAEP